MIGKEFIFDIETTGVHHYDRGEVISDGSVRLIKENGVVQLTGQVVIDGKNRELYNEYFKPLKGQMVDPEALKVNGTTMEKLRGFQEPRIAFDKLMNILELWIDPYDKRDKFTLIGYNSRFDDDFTRKWFGNIDDSVYYGSFFRWPAIDVSNLAAVYIGDGWKDMENFKLATVARELGLEVDNARLHDSAYDVDVTIRMYRFLCEKMGLQ